MGLNAKIAGLIVLFATFFCALAIMDFSIIHMSYNVNDWQYPYWLYKYWIALGVVVVVFASTVAYLVWLAKMPKRYAYASFATVILLFIGGFLDLFFFLFTRVYGEGYSFDYWSAQYKWFGSWNWSQQIAWTALCLIGVALTWYLTLKKR